jgi:3-oxoacyl-[acyl-carrier protein] reductase
MEIRLDGKAMLITGASTGLGRATAVMAAESGAFVGIDYCHSEEEARHTLELVKTAGGKGVLIQADVTKRPDVDRMIEEFLGAADGRLDILVNNAGGMVKRGNIDEIDDAVWDEVFALNATSTFLCSRAAVPIMKRQGSGVIINISSIAAATGGAGGATHYAAAKGAVNTLTVGLAKELASHNIRVVGIMPGVIPTLFHEKYTPPDVMERLHKSIPLRRFGKPEQVAAAVVFLASDYADFITNTFLNISGGW